MFDEDIRIQNHIHKLRSYTEVCTEFFYYLFYLYKHAGWIGGKGIGIQGLSANALHALLFPLPPLSEQKRIVSKIKESEPLMEKYADVEKYLDKLNTEFPDQLRKSILQEAVQGKLVPQDPTDEPVSVLLERIRAEKQHLVKEGRSRKTSTNPSFSEGIILIMRSWTESSVVSTMKYRLRFRRTGNGRDLGK